MESLTLGIAANLSIDDGCILAGIEKEIKSVFKAFFLCFPFSGMLNPTYWKARVIRPKHMEMLF